MSLIQRASSVSAYSHVSGLIQVEHVSRVITTRAQKTTILDDVTFAVPAGSLFAINGPSGSGKSTVLNMLTGLDRPTSGRVLFDGQELLARSENQLARWRGKHVGIVFQFFQLVPTLTSVENVLLALQLGRGGASEPSERSGRFGERSGRPGGPLPRRQWRARARAHECLRLVGVVEHANRLPSELSGGQQQRVAIARALANDPPVLVADEPTGNLDSHSAHEVFDVLAGLVGQGKTVVYVTHDTRLAARASARIELLDGRIVGSAGAQAIVVVPSAAAAQMEVAR